MKTTSEKLRQLRETLDENRSEHDHLALKAKIIRERSQVTRELCNRAFEEMLAIVESNQKLQQSPTDDHTEK